MMFDFFLKKSKVYEIWISRLLLSLWRFVRSTFIIINRVFFSKNYQPIFYNTRLSRILIIPTSRLLFFIALSSIHLHRTYTITYLLPQALSLLIIESSIQNDVATWLIKIFFFSRLDSGFPYRDKISPSDKSVKNRGTRKQFADRRSMQPRIIIDPVSRNIFFDRNDSK